MTTEDNGRAGDTLGSYELLSRVGRGGMATVWAARHRGAHGFSKIVALKTMLPELSEEPEFQRMFLAEGTVAARIRHPNVVETLDLGEEEGLLYIVMEWIDGETLSAVMKSAFLQGGMPLPIAVKLVIDACAGAHAAHELCDDDNRPLGLVHRDVSPPNILISYDGVVKLTDFGVAKTIDVNSTFTLAGQVKGKLRYMAPEQLLGAAIDRRTDVFALGISLYQLTTGRHPWPGDTAAVTMRRILSESPTSPATFVEGYPPALERIVLKSLDRNPAERFQTAAEMALAIEDSARSSGAVATSREVGMYVTELLGAHGAARRDTLRSAVRDIDTRSQRDTAKQLRHIDATWELEPAVDASPELVPAAQTAPTAEIVTLRPYSADQPAPPRRPDADGTSPRRLAMMVAELVVRRRSDRSKRFMLLGAAVVLLTGAYALGGHLSSDAGVAAAAPLSPPASIVPAEGSVSECIAVATSAVVAPAPPAFAATSTIALHKENVRRPLAILQPRRTHVAPNPEIHRETESEPDVGF